MTQYYSYILFAYICSLQSFSNCHTAYEETDLLLCRYCGADVGDTSFLFTKLSPGAKTEQQNYFGKNNVTLQYLVNPFGIQFEIITLEKANCANMGSPQRADSWFPNYTWKICTCPRCGQHLGWTFEIDSKESQDINKFHGIITKRVISENFTDSLIMMPKSYEMR